MACPCCSFARTFARRTAGLQAPSRRTFATSTTGLEQGESQKATPPTPSNAPKSTEPAGASLPTVNLARRGKIRDPNNRPPPPSHNNITQRLGVRFARPVPGAQEWTSSTYSYNKATVKTFPTAAQKTDELLKHYSVLRHIGDAPSSRTAIANRRKSAEKWYISKAGIKDFGDKIRIDAYAFDERAAQADLMKQKKEANAARQAATGAGRGAPRGPGAGARGGAAPGAPSRAPGGRPPFRGRPAGGRAPGGRAPGGKAPGPQ